MASQKERVLPIGPGFNAAQTSPDSRVNTQVQQQVIPQRTAGTGMDGLSSALGNFFGNAASLVDRAGQIETRNEVVATERENRELGVQGQRDAEAGQNADLDKMKRYDYFTAYQATIAQRSATEAANAYAAKVAAAPTDGTFDASKAQKEALDTDFGKGSGEAHFDDTYLVAFKRATDPLVRTHQLAVIQTTKANAVDAFKQNTTGLLQSQQGITGTDVTDLQDKAIALAGGDVGVGKKLFTATLASAIVNPGQAQSALVALEKSGWATQNADSYLDFTKTAAARVAQTTNFDAMQRYASLHNRIDAATVDPTTSTATIMRLNEEVQDTFRRFGGLGEAQGLIAKMNHLTPKFMADKATLNTVIAAHDGNVPLEVVAANLSAKPPEEVNKFLDAATFALVNRPGPDGKPAYPALAASAQGTFVNPLANDEAAQEFVRFTTNSRVMNASAGMLSPNMKSVLSRGLTDSADPGKQARALTIFKGIEQSTGKDFVGRYMDPAAEGQYRAARLYAGTNATDYFTRLANNPAEKELFKDSTLPWAKLTGSTKKDSEVETTVGDAIRKGLLAGADRNGWFSGYSVTLPNPDTEREMMAEVARRLQGQVATTGSGNVDDAVKLTLDTYKDRTVTLPGYNKTLQVFMDPMQGKGRDIAAPVASVAGQAVYAPAKIKNALGEVEDTVATYHEDAKLLLGAVGGKAEDPKSMSLQLSDKSANGLFRVMNTKTGNFLSFHPGEPLQLPNAEGVTALAPDFANAASGVMPGEALKPTETITIPKAPDEARAFLEARLPKGFHLIDGGVQGGVQAFTVAYGFRLKVGQKEKAEILDKREAEVLKTRETAAANRAAAVPRVPTRDPLNPFDRPGWN